jgi:hypothetical protein
MWVARLSDVDFIAPRLKIMGLGAKAGTRLEQPCGTYWFMSRAMSLA